ncbi:hypothetical protein SERLA73DRAFT_185021 [Serpula lacrymans var. lacrymans S7.3]|uniref:Uncharacterized protein n=2 Tax=Serpula lacrymans var. lacrymans TaxID=341189 RepID=F8Q3X9_SERL3|nr:uncharacterized protein SERLADRAFT_473242 [Serpula lacrymans var. lacrymans S7.9]EGN96835.1 hypothetical protein SERLA73DRAFT_185021 [Serpula lacrymans var. lacrymans S7.3]EGO22437.1 hypothetical protein SERLADRAFT_473242 [Serpula lacrymans var. lacrymans S7.9]
MTTDSVSASDSRTQPQAAPSVEPEPAPALSDYHIPVTKQLPMVAANTSAQNSESLTSSSVTSQQGLDKFDIATFDFTASSSWEALGKMWQVTYGYPPSQEQLMQFVLSGGTVTGEPPTSELGGEQSGERSEPDWLESKEERGYSDTWGSGTGQGNGHARGRGGSFEHGNYRDSHEQWGYMNSAYGQHTDAVILGEGGGQESSDGAMEGQVYADAAGQQTDAQEQLSNATRPQTGGTGGRMQRVGDKWMFVREAASGVV